MRCSDRARGLLPLQWVEVSLLEVMLDSAVPLLDARKN